jgi:hypothetical protein
MTTRACLCGGYVTATENTPDAVEQAVREHQGTLWHLAWRGRNGWPKAPPRILTLAQRLAAA